MRQPAHGGNIAWAAAIAGCSPGAIVDFSASISPLGPPSSILAAIADHMSSLKHYPDPDYSELRLALSHFHQIPYEWILPGNGSAELLTLVGKELSKLAATAIATPAFGDYYRALKAYDAKVLEFPLSLITEAPLSLNFDKEENTSRQGLILNNPHNPTGKLFTKDEILPYLEQFALVVVDEAFMDFLPPHQEQSLIQMVQNYPNLVILRSLTKFYSLPGLRLGYALAHPDRLRRWQSWRDPWPVSALAAAAAIAAVADQDFQMQTWAWLEPTRKQLFEGLAQIPGLKPLKSAANFLLVESEHSSLQLQQKLLKNQQILIRDCLSFPRLGSRFFRIAVLGQSDNQRLLAAISSVINE